MVVGADRDIHTKPRSTGNVNCRCKSLSVCDTHMQHINLQGVAGSHSTLRRSSRREIWLICTRLIPITEFCSDDCFLRHAYTPRDWTRNTSADFAVRMRIEQDDRITDVIPLSRNRLDYALDRAQVARLSISLLQATVILIRIAWLAFILFPARGYNFTIGSLRYSS